MALVFRFAARSETGVVRSKNDDSGYAGRYFAVVADGMGGHAGGDVASASTVLDLAHLDTLGFAEPDTVLPDEIQTANAFLNKLVKANPKLSGMGTTITSLLITGDRLQFAHIGDSRAYRLKKGRFRQVSKDHTFVQRLVDEGRLDPDEAEFHPHKNVLMRVLGDVDASPELDITSFPLEAGERWLLCSDGLNAVVSDRLVEQKLRSSRSLESIVEELVDLTLEGGAPDNVTVLCLEVVEADEQDLTPSRRLPLTQAAVDAAAEGYQPPTGQSTGGEHPGDAEETMELVPVVNVDALSEHPPEEDDELSPLTASMLGQGLETRPHLLVGAADKATETGMIPVVARNVDEHPMAVLLTGQPLIPVRHTYSEMLGDHREHPAEETPRSEQAPEVAETAESPEEQPAETSGATPAVTSAGASAETSEEAPLGEDEDPDLSDPALTEADMASSEIDVEDVAIASRASRRRRWFLPTFVTLLALLLGVVTFLGYIWTQTQYYVGQDDGEVAIYNGVSQSLGPIPLSGVDEHAGFDVEELSPYHRERVLRGIPADDRSHADTIVEQLRATTASAREAEAEEADAEDAGTEETDEPTEDGGEEQ
ncbi:PP2C family protein-serine/threonine phosphatase [Nesterenkonia xinjiangensis]|uniref:Protein phosphatase n=1 Tax=Nesterenkonia xinjiangensis TaxID=225327 RepID=A0A7Z0GL95_9MICC|nr:protein phosphatase [Nesterenkonia xinjiangensis]